MKKFWVFLAIWISFLLAVAGLNEASRQKDVETKLEFSVVNEADSEILIQLQQAMQNEDYLLALDIADKNHRKYANLPSSSKVLAFQFFYLKGHVHSALWQHIEAEKSWQFSLNFAETKDQKTRIKSLIKAGRMLVNDSNDERKLSNVYKATPNTGPASELKGKIAVVYIFLTDGALQTWSLRKRNFVMNSWTIAEQWLIKNAAEYNANLSFSRRLFIVEKNPFIRRLQVGDFDKQNQHAGKVAQLVAEHFGAKDILTFIEKIKREEKADQAVLLFHLARDGRSFAQRCVIRCSPDGEYAYLMETPSAKRGNFMNYAQAHETLHLFGADDLYNIRSAKHYFVRDIMNYPASILAANTLEPITAFAVGLNKNKPGVPFDVEVYARKN